MSQGPLHTVVETPEFLRAAKAARLSPEERARIVSRLAARPDAGDLIPGTGGARKVRFRGRGHGTSGGYRVVTVYVDADLPVFALSVFAKGDRVDLSAAERSELKQVIAAIIEAYRRGEQHDQSR